MIPKTRLKGRKRRTTSRSTGVRHFPLILPVSPAEVIAEFLNHASPGTLGVHGLMTWGTTTERRTSAYVGLHETFHEYVLSGTPFGFLQRYFRSFRQPWVTPRHHAWAEGWTRLLMDESQVAHEAAATYLSITTLRTEEQAAVIRDLAPEYRRYYHIFATPLDAIVRSTFVRYAIGQKIAALAFHSPLLRRVAAQRMTAPRSLSADDSPNARLTRLLALFQPIALQSLMQAVVADLVVVAAVEGHDQFDANNESAWLAASPELRVRLDFALEECIHAWLNKQECDLSVIDPEEARALVPRLIARAKRLGAFLGVVDEQFLHKFWPEPDGERTAQMELMNAESVLFNEPTMNNKTVEQLPDNGWPVPRNPAVKTVVVGAYELYVPDTPNDWYLSLAGKGGCDPIWSLAQARLDAFCKDRRQAWRELGSAARDNDLYVLGLPAPITPEPENWTSMALYDAMQMFRVQEDPARANDTEAMRYYGNLDRLVVYMHGNMMSWVNWFDYLPGPRYPQPGLEKNLASQNSQKVTRRSASA